MQFRITKEQVLGAIKESETEAGSITIDEIIFGVEADGDKVILILTQSDNMLFRYLIPHRITKISREVGESYLVEVMRRSWMPWYSQQTGFKALEEPVEPEISVDKEAIMAELKNITDLVEAATRNILLTVAAIKSELS